MMANPRVAEQQAKVGAAQAKAAPLIAVNDAIRNLRIAQSDLAVHIVKAQGCAEQYKDGVAWAPEEGRAAGQDISNKLKSNLQAHLASAKKQIPVAIQAVVDLATSISKLDPSVYNNGALDPAAFPTMAKAAVAALDELGNTIDEAASQFASERYPQEGFYMAAAYLSFALRGPISAVDKLIQEELDPKICRPLALALGKLSTEKWLLDKLLREVARGTTKPGEPAPIA